MAYIGPEPNPGQNREVDDISSSFNGSTTAFTLQVNSQNVSPGSSNAIIVSLGGVVQNPGTDYTVAASTLTFTTAPASGLAFFGLVLGQQVDTADANFNNPVITGDLSIADKIVHTGDTNNAIRFPAADTITAETAGSERVRIDSSGNVGIGVTTPSSFNSDGRNLVVGTGSGGQGLSIYSANNNYGNIYFADGTSDGSYNAGGILYNHSSNFMRFDTAAAERMRIDSSGNVGIGTTSPDQKLHIANSGTCKLVLEDTRTSISTGSQYAVIQFEQRDSNTPGIGAEVAAFMQDTTNGATALQFTTGTPSTIAERMRINADGDVLIGTTTLGTTHAYFEAASSSRSILYLGCGNTGNSNVAIFMNPNGNVGFIRTNGSSTSYETSSDYRLKENQVAISDGITRLKSLKPYKFNFKADATTTVDGFFAHEAATVVPEAVSGTKDEVVTQTMIDAGDYKEGTLNNPIHQGIDQSKLVPLLTAALQEAIAKIEVLETKVAALEAA